MWQIRTFLCVAAAIATAGSFGGAASLRETKSPAQKGAPLVVGWNDEFNALNWEPFAVPHKPDISMRHKGFLGLTLGSDAPVDPRLPFNWGTVSRVVEADTDRYPILAVRAIHLKAPGWWDVSLQGCQTTDPRTTIGKEVKTPSLDHDGTILFDLQAQVKNGLNTGTHRLLIRLNIAGPKKGTRVEYDWIRFIRREDEERLRSHMDIGELVVEP